MNQKHTLVHIEYALTKEAFENLKKLLRKRNISLETKKIVVDCYVASVLLYDSECWIIYHGGGKNGKQQKSGSIEW